MNSLCLRDWYVNHEPTKEEKEQFPQRHYFKLKGTLEVRTLYRIPPCSFLSNCVCNTRWMTWILPTTPSLYNKGISPLLRLRSINKTTQPLLVRPRWNNGRFSRPNKSYSLPYPLLFPPSSKWEGSSMVTRDYEGKKKYSITRTKKAKYIQQHHTSTSSADGNSFSWLVARR